MTSSQQPEQEGVIKYKLEFTPTSPLDITLVHLLTAWRHICKLTGLIGQDPHRYEGYGFGNISARIAPNEAPFLISGSQTGHLETLTAAHYAVVEQCFPAENRVVARGPLRPSSESMTHGTIYQQDPTVQAVIHAHSPDIWRCAERLALPQTAASIPYGSPEMAEEVARLFIKNSLSERQIFSMKGHEDGIVAFGSSLDEAGHILIQTFASALTID
ncbi:MAG: class II aldolase/adducin family protein [Ardenticatenaceae bacterium]|nr:class II aldolase/adducin family protein [Ardenticatenaceae bacterium]